MTGRYANYFLLTAIIYFLVSAVRGLAMIMSWMDEEWRGVGFHDHVRDDVPRRARLLRTAALLGKAAWIHLIVANAATMGMALFFGIYRWQGGRWIFGLAVSGSLQFLGVLIFVFNMLASLVSGKTKLEVLHDYARRSA